MARVAYVDHSYHRKTRSTLFLPELLAAAGHDVELFWDDAWIGGEPVRWETVAGHDVVIMFQSYCSIEARTFRELHSNVVYIPMFDQFGLPHRPPRNLSAFWGPFQGSKVLSFSSAVHVLAASSGIVSHVAHYYPDVEATPPVTSTGLHGFFWLRRGMEVGWATIRSLVGQTSFDSFHVHVAGDPGFPPVESPPQPDLDAFNATTSTWFEQRSDLERMVRRANVYFAPRLAEGIGQSFLEAMARGQCVVAPDNPTMSEYIVHGVNGLLYDPHNPKPLDFSDVARIGEQARRGTIAGRSRWRAKEPAIIDFVLMPSAALYGDGDLRGPSPSARAEGHSGDGLASHVSRAVRVLGRARSSLVRVRK